MRSLSIAAAAALLAMPAQAADPVIPAGDAPPADARDIVADIGIGATLSPRFPSSQEYVFSPWPIAALRYLRLPYFGEVVTGRPSIFSIYPSFNFVGEREADDANYLAGTGDTELAVELGPGIAIQRGPIRGFVEVRYGLSGHSGIVGEAGLEFIARQHERFQLSIGPRVGFASDDYMDTYFEVNPAAAVLAPYDPDAGIKDVGVGLEADYALTPRVRLHGRASYSRFVGDAADSPIVEAGSHDSFTIGVGISYRFGLDLY